MEYLGNDRFALHFMRHTGEWVGIYDGLSVDECMKAIREFVELEVVLRPDQPEVEGVMIATELMARLGIDDPQTHEPRQPQRNEPFGMRSKHVDASWSPTGSTSGSARTAGGDPALFT